MRPQARTRAGTRERASAVPVESISKSYLRSFAQRLEVFAHNAYGILGPHRLELFAGSSPVAGQVVNGANDIVSLAGSLEGKMGATLPGGLEYHGLLIIGIDAAVCQNGRRVDDKNIKIKAALAAAQAEHNTAQGRAAYCSLREPRSVTTPMNKFTGIYGLSPMVCDPIPISLRCFSLSLESFQLLATNLTSNTMRFEVK